MYGRAFLAEADGWMFSLACGGYQELAASDKEEFSPLVELLLFPARLRFMNCTCQTVTAAQIRECGI